VAKVREIRDLGDTELFERLESDKEELFNLRFQLATGQLDNPMRIKQVRHEIAQILTIVRERDLEVEGEEQLAAQAGAPAGVNEEER
jgi:large subunit ribosomal protein L29